MKHPGFAHKAPASVDPIVIPPVVGVEPPVTMSYSEAVDLKLVTLTGDAAACKATIDAVWRALGGSTRKV